MMVSPSRGSPSIHLEYVVSQLQLQTHGGGGELQRLSFLPNMFESFPLLSIWRFESL